MLRVPVPRNLRVRPSVQIASARVPARAFLLCAGLVVIGGLAIAAGAALGRTVRLTSVAIVLGLAAFELRCWGRSTPEAVRLVLRHCRRTRRLRLEPAVIVLPAETAAPAMTRRPRWRE